MHTVPCSILDPTSPHPHPSPRVDQWVDGPFTRQRKRWVDDRSRLQGDPDFKGRSLGRSAGGWLQHYESIIWLSECFDRRA